MQYLAPPKNAAAFFKHFAKNEAVKAAREHASSLAVKPEASGAAKTAIKNGDFGYFAQRFPHKQGGWFLVGLNSHLPVPQVELRNMSG